MVSPHEMSHPKKSAASKALKKKSPKWKAPVVGGVVWAKFDPRHKLI
jgi:hypothetical protein